MKYPNPKISQGILLMKTPVKKNSPYKILIIVSPFMKLKSETFPPEGVSISLSDGEPDVEERSFLLTNLPL